MSTSASNLARKVDARLTACAALAGAALAARTAQAVIVYTDFSSNSLSTVPFDVNGVYVNLATGAAANGTIAGWDLNIYFAGSTTANPTLNFYEITSTDANRGGVGTGTAATRLTLGTTIGSTSGFLTGILSGANFQAQTGYYGFRFTNDSTGAVNYGWALVQSTANPPTAGSVRLLSFAYENSGLAINAGQIPEPTTIALLGMAAGALGVREWRRRRAA